MARPAARGWGEGVSDEQRCGLCKWFVPSRAFDGFGECEWKSDTPIPACVVHVPVHEEDDDCPTFERKEG